MNLLMDIIDEARILTEVAIFSDKLIFQRKLRD